MILRVTVSRGHTPHVSLYANGDELIRDLSDYFEDSDDPENERAAMWDRINEAIANPHEAIQESSEDWLIYRPEELVKA